MKIGIDARFLTHPQPGGFKTYTHNLIKAISQVDKENTYILYVDRPPDDVPMPAGKNISVQVVTGRLPGIGMPAREQVFLRRQISRDRPDGVHFLCNTATTHPMAPSVLTLHDTIQVTEAPSLRYATGVSGYKRALIADYSRWAILKTARYARRIITVSSYEKAQISEALQVKADRIRVTPLAPDPLFTQLSEQQRCFNRKDLADRLGIHKPFLLAVGYEPRKNIPLLIEMLVYLAALQVVIDLVIVAAENKARELLAQNVAACGLSGRVHLLPGQTTEELAVLYNLAEAFLFPSERESFGLPPLEAMACGTPVAVLNATSLPEVVGDGALLIDVKDAVLWALVVGRLLQNPELRSSLIKRGQRRAATFTWDRTARQTIDVYHEVMEASVPI